MRYGAFDTLQDAVERRVNVADRAKPMSFGRIVGIAAAVPTGGLSYLAGELSNYLNKPDVLIRRGLRNLPSGPAGPSTGYAGIGASLAAAANARSSIEGNENQ